MNIGDLVTYGDWYYHNQSGNIRTGVILEVVDACVFYVWWHGDTFEWEELEDLEFICAAG